MELYPHSARGQSGVATLLHRIFRDHLPEVSDLMCWFKDSFMNSLMNCFYNFMSPVAWILQCVECVDETRCLHYTTKVVRGPMTKINQSNRSIPCPIFPSIGPGIVPNDPTLCPAFNLKSRRRTMQVFVTRCFCCWLSISPMSDALSSSDINFDDSYDPFDEILNGRETKWA